ncbi:S-methyl-5-thioribose kinase [Marinicrinis sediminis]|uniref:Methylthioribose kinase n=1 Tax=Marinicrinis sediminis TaxID=1652465 RepID=A0ABW5R930_9BACL
MSNYHPLTEQEAITLAQTHVPLLQQATSLTCREIGDGNLNLVFHIQDTDTSNSVIVKQALPYAKVVGESWPLTLDRARIESEALRIQGELCPELVPAVYQYLPELAVTMMEDLSDHVIMRSGLIAGNQYPYFAAHISEFLARTLFFTSDLGINQQEKKIQQGSFINPELCKITEDLIFDDPYTDSPNNQYNPAIQDVVDELRSDEELHLQVAKLRHQFLTHSQALLHGDLHTGSVFVTKQSTKVIDPEFAFYGPMGFDIGAVIANLLLNYAGQLGWMEEDQKRQAFQQYLLHTIQEIWTQFESKFRQLWKEHGVDRISAQPSFQDAYLTALLQDTLGFAGCKMVRRIVGLAHVADIDTIKQPELKEQAERLAIRIGTTLIKEHDRFHHIEQLMDKVQQLHAESL